MMPLCKQRQSLGNLDNGGNAGLSYVNGNNELGNTSRYELFDFLGSESTDNALRTLSVDAVKLSMARTT